MLCELPVSCASPSGTAVKAGTCLHPRGHGHPASCSAGDPSALAIAGVTKTHIPAAAGRCTPWDPPCSHSPPFSPRTPWVLFPRAPCSPRAPGVGGQRGCCSRQQAESRCFWGGGAGKGPRRAAAAGPGMLRCLPGCDLRSGQEGAGEARARARGAPGFCQPSAPGGGSRKVKDQPDPRSAPPFTPPELGERLVPFPALRSHASAST